MYHYFKAMTASNYAATNLTPRTNLERVKNKVDSRTYEKLVRSRSAHFNALEGFPLFAAAMVRLSPLTPFSQLLSEPGVGFGMLINAMFVFQEIFVFNELFAFQKMFVC
jgi:hypothetical protein